MSRSGNIISTNSLASEFDPKVRQRGREYFDRGAVRIIEQTADELFAIVLGTTEYEVYLYLGFDGWDCECDCEAFQKWGPCKHIWATLLRAEASGWIGDNRQSAKKRMPEAKPARPVSPPPPPPPPRWKKELKRLRHQMEERRRHQPPEMDSLWPEDRRIVYVIDVPGTLHESQGLIVEVDTEKRRPDGQWDRPKRSQMSAEQWASAPDPADRHIAQMLLGARTEYGAYYGESARRFRLPGSAYATTLKAICETGRCKLKRAPDDHQPITLAWDDAPPWEFRIALQRDEEERYQLEGYFVRARARAVADADVRSEARADAPAGAPAVDREVEQRMPLSEPSVVLSDGLLIAGARIAMVRHFGAWELLWALRTGSSLAVFESQADEFLKELLAMPDLPPLKLPEHWKLEQSRPTPRPVLKIHKPKKWEMAPNRLLGELSFEYGDRLLAHEQSGAGIYHAQTRQLVYRDVSFERNALARLMQAGFRREWAWNYSTPQLQLPAAKLGKTVLQLTREGWRIEAEGKLYRQAGEIKVSVSSGIDWFELDAKVDFGGQTASLPRLLAAVRKGENTVVLDDGTLGILPEQWLKKYAALAGVGSSEKADDGVMRFSKAQVGFLDALLASMPEAREATCDAVFERARDELRRFEGIEAAEEPDSFIGTLRPYQREGLGWLHFLRRFSFGGCLADDMGLGKTVQVLALLEQRRQETAGASLVVVPRSLIFNWREEAKRFCPELRVLDQSGLGRKRGGEHFADYDLVLTTYGTLRRDAEYFKDVRFDYVILDEAQAVKNSSTASAKAVRLLQADHRLAMSGTPIENHIGELWSLFEFLNPGMLGSASVFKSLVDAGGRAGAGGNGAGAGAAEESGRALLARALRPFILRRTKGQVARELPEKLEQTIVCELDQGQRKLYDELRDHYRAALLRSIETIGMARAKIQILEALLRLRQAACHPGLIDKRHLDGGSAKLEALLNQLDEVMAEDHKVLVFSQFTKFLAIVRTALDKRGVVYEYLDGKTRDRQARVERFQSDPACKLFLISLKAGGLGLNLTAAEYVFLLDPWWNPAVEAQAIDRAHRIGQQRPVFAYRLIARDTVEEKVLQLQQSKRDLADAIINADNSLISKLGREDLELLLG